MLVHASRRHVVAAAVFVIILQQRTHALGKHGATAEPQSGHLWARACTAPCKPRSHVLRCSAAWALCLAVISLGANGCSHHFPCSQSFCSRAHLHAQCIVFAAGRGVVRLLRHANEISWVSREKCINPQPQHQRAIALQRGGVHLSDALGTAVGRARSVWAASPLHEHVQSPNGAQCRAMGQALQRERPMANAERPISRPPFPP